MKFQTVSLALALAAVTAAPIAAQEMQATMPVASGDDAPLADAAPVETVSDSSPAAEASAPAETAPVETTSVEAAPAATAPVETAQVAPALAAEPAPVAKRTFAEKATIAAGTFAAAYAAFEAMKALTKKKSAAPAATE